MDLKPYISILWRRMWVIIFTVVATMVVVIIGTHLQTPIYQSSTTLRIATSAGSQMSYQDYQYVDRLMNTYIQIATSDPVLAELMKRLNLSESPKVKAEIISNTELIKITVEDTNPSKAATEANTMANILITKTGQLYTGGGISSTDVLGKQLAIAKDGVDSAQLKYQQLLIQTPAAPEEIAVAQQALILQQNTYATLLSQYEQASIRETMQANMVTIVEPAVIPLSPSKPSTIINYTLGFVVGLLGGLGLAFLFENLDTTLYTLDDIESISKLDTIARIPRAKKKQIDISESETSPFVEVFRNLAARILLLDIQQPNNVLLLMSAEPRQGKSMIVANLAYALSEAGKKVIAIDCDLRRPKLHTLFHLSNQYGLSDILDGKADLNESLKQSQSKDVYVLTTGSLPDHPSKILSSPQMAELINRLSHTYDFILIDSPALIPFSDTEILSRYANGLIVVVRRGHAKREAIQATTKFLALFKENVIGCIVNQIEDHNGRYGYYQYQK